MLNNCCSLQSKARGKAQGNKVGPILPLAICFPSKLAFFIHPARPPASSSHPMPLRCTESEAVRLFYLQVNIHSLSYGAIQATGSNCKDISSKAAPALLGAELRAAGPAGTLPPCPPTQCSAGDGGAATTPANDHLYPGGILTDERSYNYSLTHQVCL